MGDGSGRQAVLGLGGVFVRARDPEALAAWYAAHLGFDVHDFGGPFGAVLPLAGSDVDYQLWTAFPPDATELGGPDQAVMLNLRVADLDAMLAQLRADGVAVEDRVERSEHGGFGWCRDGEGNRVELWQPALTPGP